MKISLNWLKEFAPFNLSAKEAVQVSSRLGLEISEVEERFAGFEQFVVGEMTAVEPHPNADKLRLVTVNLGKETVKLVCGAPNARVGIKVAVAMTGTKLPNGMELKKAKIRGVESLGMVLSRTELSLEEKSAGVWELPNTAVVGSTLRDLVGPADSILTFELTPNRADALSHLGIARDLSASLGLSLKSPDCAIKSVGARKALSLAKVEIQAPDLCPRYCAMVIENVKVGPSPLWVQERLSAAGMRPISNVVDATNYVLMEMGHPMHAFDLSLLKDSTIIVRRAKSDERLTTLDGVERVLTPEMLVIADAERPVGLAGIMGGGNSEVNEKTTTILLESAYFISSGIRRTARSFGLGTEASYRFERGADIIGLEAAMKRCAQMIAEISGGVIADGIIDVYPTKYQATVLSLRASRVQEILGFTIEESSIERHLRALQFGVQKKGNGLFEVVVPSFRVDITREIDLIEEIARLEGYDKIPTVLSGTLGAQRTPRVHEFITAARHAACSLGFSECVSYPFERQSFLNLPQGEAPIKVMNPINAEEPFLRTSLIPSLARSLRHNVNHGLKGVRLFEAGRSFILHADHQPEEQSVLSIILSGENEVSLGGHSAANTFATLKGVVEGILSRLGVSSFVLQQAESTYFRKGETAELLFQGKRAALFGALSNSLKKELDLEGEVYGAEIWLERIMGSDSKGAVPVYSPLPRHPSSWRDLAVVASESVAWGTIETTVRQAAGNLLEEITLFDVYGGKGAKGIEPGKRSLAFRLTFRASDRTLTVDEVESVQQKIVKALFDQHGAKLRGE